MSIEDEARAEALREYSHSKVRDRYDADLMMAGFIDGAAWQASRQDLATREEVAGEISGITVGSGYESVAIGIAAALEAADALLAAFTITKSTDQEDGERR